MSEAHCVMNHGCKIHSYNGLQPTCDGINVSGSDRGGLRLLPVAECDAGPEMQGVALVIKG